MVVLTIFFMSLLDRLAIFVVVVCGVCVCVCVDEY